MKNLFELKNGKVINIDHICYIEQINDSLYQVYLTVNISSEYELNYCVITKNDFKRIMEIWGIK